MNQDRPSSILDTFFLAEVETIRCIRAVLSAYQGPALVTEVETIRCIRFVLSAYQSLVLVAEVETIRCTRFVLSGLYQP